MMRCTVDFQDSVANFEEADGRTIDMQLKRADKIRSVIYMINSAQEGCASRCAAAMNNDQRQLTQNAGIWAADASAY